MQKINRERLKQALDHEEQYNEIHRHYEEIIVKAAAILLEITDPEFVPSDVMLCAVEADEYEWLNTSETDVFRAMMKELTE